MHFNKVCEETDWYDPNISRIMNDNLHLPADISTRKERKHWEWAMGMHALEFYGFLDRTRTALGLGCGHETFMYALANHVKHVVVTDLYGTTSFRGLEANADILEDPSKYCSFPYDKDRLRVRSMDARKIEYPDDHFDILFSFSSLEHFGRDADIVQSTTEAYRVLKRGGVYVLSVDFIYRESWPRLPRQWRWPGANEFMTAVDIQNLLLKPSGFKLEQDILCRVKPENITNVYDVLRKKSLGTNTYPHIHLMYRIPCFRKYLFTSLSLVLFKR